MTIDWTEELVEFIKDRQYQSISKTIIEVQDRFGIVLTEEKLNRKYEQIVKGSVKKKRQKVRVHCRSFRARGIKYWFTVARYGALYVGALRTEPYTIESAPTQVDLKIALRAAKLSYLRDMDKLIDPAIAHRIREQWIQSNISLNQISKNYNISVDVAYGICYGHIHESPEYPRGVNNKARGLSFEVFAGEPAKTILGWTQDPRCRASWRTIHNRWHSGVRGPNLIKEGVNREAKYYYIYGEYKTLSEWVNDPRCEVSWQCLRKRIRNGHNIDMHILKKDWRKLQ